MNREQVIESWVGRSETMTDIIDGRQARLMRSLIPGDAALEHGDLLPPLWHWAWFLHAAPLSDISPDGHPNRGDGWLLPPVAMEQRMWAGGRLHYSGHFHIGDEIEKTSTIAGIRFKEGRTGGLCFVSVNHRYTMSDSEILTEEQEIVYRKPGKGDKPRAIQAEQEAEYETEIRPDPVMLFRYSALTFNAHRIHYDADYCRDVEGYPALVVQGPLTATLLADFASSHQQGQMVDFSFRAVAPLFVGRPICLNCRTDGSHCFLWANDPDGNVGMWAEAEFE